MWQRRGAFGVILHSDRGRQFISGDAQRILGQNASMFSIIASGCCADVAACEGSLGQLERVRVDPQDY